MGIVSNLWANEGRDDISPTSTLPIHEHDPLLFSKSLIFFNVFIRVVFYFPFRVFEDIALPFWVVATFFLHKNPAGLHLPDDVLTPKALTSLSSTVNGL